VRKLINEIGYSSKRQRFVTNFMDRSIAIVKEGICPKSFSIRKFRDFPNTTICDFLNSDYK